MWVSIVSVTDHCLFIYFESHITFVLKTLHNRQRVLTVIFNFAKCQETNK